MTDHQPTYVSLSLRQRVAAVEARQAELLQGIVEFRTSPTISKATAQLEKALDVFSSAAAVHNSRCHEMVTEFAGSGDLPAGVDYHAGFSIHVAGQTFRPVNTQTVIAKAATEAIRKHFGPRQQVDFGRH